MAPDQTNILQGTLDMMILKSLALAEMHGLGISRRIEQITKGTFQVKPGSLFPALHRMEEEGWLVSYWGESENNRRAKYYKLASAGRRQLEAETKRWDRIALAITRTLEANTAIFQLLDAVRLRTLPVKHPEHIARINIDHRNGASGNFTTRYADLTYGQWEQILARQQAFSNKHFCLGAQSVQHFTGWGSSQCARTLGKR